MIQISDDAIIFKRFTERMKDWKYYLLSIAQYSSFSIKIDKVDCQGKRAEVKGKKIESVRERSARWKYIFILWRVKKKEK